MSRGGHEVHFLSTHGWVTGSQTIFSSKLWHFVRMSMLSQFFLIPLKRSSGFLQTGRKQCSCGILLLPMHSLSESFYKYKVLWMKLVIDCHLPLLLEDQLVLGKYKAKMSLFCIGAFHHHLFLHKLDYCILEGWNWYRYEIETYQVFL